MNAKLALENGLVLTGTAFGWTQDDTQGEVVFNTAMTGYQEILSDPSYCGQIVTMTYPHIGNYGTNLDDSESFKPRAAGIIVKEHSTMVSNWRSAATLDEFLAAHRVMGLAGIDTRMLVRALRTDGALRGVISTNDLDDKRLVERANNIPSMSGLDLASVVTCKDAYLWDRAEETRFVVPTRMTAGAMPRVNGARHHVVVMDFGVKQNILRRLVAYGCRLTVVPASTSATAIHALKPDGIFLSNGPGDPEAVTYAIDTIRALIGSVPIFGICLGHQLLALALGGKTYKLKFGHHGANHPVKNLQTGSIEITSQNHGFCVDWSSMDASQIELTHINLNDHTVEGFRHRTLPLFCVQYHPEAAPGPHDSDYLFAQFTSMMMAAVDVPR